MSEEMLLVPMAAGIPETTAVVCGAESLTYEELNNRANQLAHYLQSKGIGPEQLVAVCLNRSIDAVVAALAVLRAGAAYLPLDHTHPPLRLRSILADAKVQLTITREPFMSAPEQNQVLDLDQEALAIQAMPASQPECRATPANLAYVIYTSGSTGQPKGVEITHSSLANLIQWHLQEFQLTPADRCSQLASWGFDAAVWEIWPCLAAGASLHIPADNLLNLPESLGAWMSSQRISISFAPTRLAEGLLSLDWPEESRLRLLLTGGDTLYRYPPPHLPFRLINNYGPTEATVVSTSACIEPALAPAPKAPAIGLPILRTILQILDPQGRAVAPGGVGELYIGGAGVARGYRNRPDLTREKFVLLAGERFFRSGDLVRSRPDGNLEFVGRIDRQLKIRGVRVEPEEIEATLNRHPLVRASAVVPHGSTGLEAFVVSDTSAEDLQEWLSQRLSRAMLPNRIVIVSALPLTSQGKVDYPALPQLPVPPPVSSRAERVARLIAKLLGLESVAPDENFFLLGGHSLMGAQLIVRIQADFGVVLGLRAIFDSPTALGLAQEIGRAWAAR